MKLTGKAKWARLTALMLALALLLTGCGGPGAGAGGTPGTEPTESAVTATATPEPSPTETEPAETGPTETGPAETDPTEGLSEEELALLQRTGLAEDELTGISNEQAAQINAAVAGMRAAYVAGPGGKDPLVEERDWSVYTSSLGRENLSRREAAYYDRLDKMCLEYLSTSGLDGIRYEYSDGSVHYATEAVRFNDLGLSKEQAADVWVWFRYNHPQYYFLANCLLWSSESLSLCMYETMSDGVDRAKITNKLFDKLDGWIQTVADSASTTYQKELYANKLLCTAVVYQKEYIGNLRVDQSLYSTVMLESTVCAGYSMAFTAMMSALGVDATAGLGGGHAWNVVRFDDGNYYCVDVCWNDTDNPSNPYKTDYLNVGENYLQKSDYTRECHTYSDDVGAWIPVIAKDSYVPTADDLGTDVTPPQNIQIRETSTQFFNTKLTQLNVSWDSTDDPFTSYEFEEYNDAGYTKRTTHRNLTGNKINISTSSLQKTYYFRVRAVKEIGGEKYYSEWVSFSYTMGSDTGSSPSPSPSPSPTSTPTASTFADVPADAWYAEAVNWAVANNITSGTPRYGKYYFNPDKTCSKGQVLDFLYRAAGEPAPKGTAPRIPSGAFYTNAANWAYGEGIIDDQFSGPDSTCTRLDAVTYVWRASGSPAARVISFSDVPADTDYATAASWAVSNGIADAASNTTFGADQDCTRGQIVYFLYRAFA